MRKNDVINFKEKSYDIIKNKIVTCELMPGEVVDQNALMEEIGVSKTPIREAINALEQEDLVVILPRRGVLVSNISVNDVSHIYTIREVMEPLIAKLATPNIEKDVMKHFAEVFNSEKLDMDEITKNDHRLHNYLAERTGNKYIIRLMDNILAQNMRIVVLGARIPKRLYKSNQEHLEIIEMMLKFDAEGAQEAMSEHIKSAKTVAAAVNSIHL